jgi:hypothetical protein
MKKIMAALCLFVFSACYNDNAESATTSTTPTLDSNTVAPVVDSNTTILYLDNPLSDTFSIAMDSAGPTVTPADTSVKKR